jgi:hypothetical protein
MSWVIEEITTSTIGFVIAMVILTAVVAGGLYGYWIYANHVTLENYLWPIAEVLPWKGEYFLAVVNTGNEPFYVEQVYLKGGTVLTPNQAVNPNLNWCSVSNTELMHNEWWCGEVNKLPVAVRVCSALDPSVCVVAPVHGWETVTFSQPTQAAFGISNCPVLASVSDPQGAGWQVVWSMAGNSYSVSKSTSYQWCILPPYYPITIDFQSTITSNPSNYQCSISPQTAQVNYNGTPTTVPFTVTCQQSRTPPPPPPPPPPSPSPPGGNNGGSAIVDTVIDAPSSVSWTVNLYFNSQLEQTYQGSGSQSYTWDAPYGASGTVSYKVSGIPNTCTVSYSPSQSFRITPGNSYTETITITCQGQPTPPPPPMCYFSYSDTTNPPGLNNYIQFGGPSSLNPGDSGTFSGMAALTAVDSQGDEYQFQYWSVTSNPSSYAWSGTTDQADFSAPLSCPSTLTSSVTVQITGTAVYQFIGCKSYSVGINLTTSGEATLSWSWCPLDPAVSWSAQASQGSSPNTIVATGYLTSKSGQTFGKSSQQVQVCQSGQQAVVTGVNPSGGSINPPQASGQVTFQVEFYCKSNNVN